MSKRLFDLSDEILALEALLDNEELTDEQRQQLVDEWLEAQGDVETKLDNTAAWIESLDTWAEMRKYQAERMLRLAKADQNKAERNRERLKLYFQRHGLTKFKTPRFTISLQANGGKQKLIFPPAWEQDLATAPGEFIKIVTELDRDALRKVVEDFYKKAEIATAGAENDDERRRLFKAWIEENEGIRATYKLIEGCGLAERGTSIRIR
jgi:Siphovirus Gp157